MAASAMSGFLRVDSKAELWAGEDCLLREGFGPVESHSEGTDQSARTYYGTDPYLGLTGSE